jgi:KUP system potassium uptake protein
MPEAPAASGRRPATTHGPRGALLPLTIGAVGVVFGDIGTSPLYSLRETFAEGHGIPVDDTTVLGVLSLIFWALVIVIAIKYVGVVMRADNEGEGGILALTALVAPTPEARLRRTALVGLGLFGAALLYGDGAITPAISVLSAVEGLELAAPDLAEFVVPISVAILVALFAIQNRGTHVVARLFGPVMLLWFGTIAVLGLLNAAGNPGVVAAVNPWYAVEFFSAHTGRAFFALGSVVLVVTGGEALYADMGHFGVRPIRRAWFAVVMPALLLNYAGQGALVLDNPEAVESPFFLLAPEWALYPLIALATAATIIASQALISGVFSLTHQAVQLDFLPRMDVRHTSATAFGQVYVPSVNWWLLVACVGLVVGFGSSANLAAAYGVAVTATMFITSILIGIYAREHWGWSKARTRLVVGGFLVVDLAFLGANLVKIPDGGWFPLALGAILYGLMRTWRAGREHVAKALRRGEQPLKALVESLARKPGLRRIPGTAVYLFPNPGRVPPAFLANLRHNEAVHESVVFLAVRVENTPRVPRARREKVVHLGSRFFEVTLRYGFMEEPDVPIELRQLMAEVAFDPLHTTYFLGKESPVATPGVGLGSFQENVFRYMHRNARSAAAYFKLPNDRVIEIGTPVDI